MSKPDDFLSRWSRRKLDPAAQTGEAAPGKPPAAAGKEAAAVAGAAEPEFDISKLPSLDSIDAASDISAFLQRGVPPALTRAALRRVWSADPAIRDFVGLSENAWDFNAPDSMPGFGPLDTDEVKRLARLLLGDPDGETQGRSSQDEPSPEETGPMAEELAPRRPDEEQTAALAIRESGPPESVEGHHADVSDGRAAPQHRSAAEPAQPTPARARHGSALPK